MSLVSHFHTSRYISWVPEAAVQLSEKAAKVRMSGDPDYQLHRKIIARITSAAWRDRNRYLIKRIGNYFAFILTITWRTVSEMIRNGNGVPVKAIKDRLKDGKNPSRPESTMIRHLLLLT